MPWVGGAQMSGQVKLKGVLGEGSLEDRMNARRKREATADRQESFQAGFRGNLHFPLCLPCTASLSPAPRVRLSYTDSSWSWDLPY